MTQMRALLLVISVGFLICLAVVAYHRVQVCSLLEADVSMPTVQTELATHYTAAEVWPRRKKMHPGWVTGSWDGLDAVLGEIREADDLQRLVPASERAKPNVCTLLLSPDGIFSHYTDKDTVVASDNNGLFFSRQPTQCWPRHIRRLLSLDEVLPLMQPGQQMHPRIALMPQYGTVRYMRLSVPVLPVMCKLGLDAHADKVAGITLYISDQHALTNFHWDGRPGMLQQFRGRKRVWLVAPQYAHYMAHAESTHPQCKRRSRFIGREERPMIPHWSVVVHPGQTVFIPARWWHQVESLDQPTVGVVIRFK